MKRLLTSVIIVMSFFSGLLQAQSTLPDSRRGSSKTYIYNINRDNLRKVHLEDEDINEDMLGKCVAEFMLRSDKLSELPAGNYVMVNAIENQLHFADYTIDDLYFKVIPSEEMMLCLYDSLGNLIEDAIVKSGSKTLKYNKVTQTYNAKSIKDGTILEVNNHGVYHYIEISKQGYSYYASGRNIFTSTWGKIKRWWNSRKYKYTGFVVFSKPKYKPGETVKFKAYVSGTNGKPYNKPLDVRLLGGTYTFNVDTILTNLAPYRPGMYEYQFALTDSLDLKLDANYSIRLKPSEKQYSSISGRFSYEDYELKSTHFSMKTDKYEYAKDDSVKVKFKVTDENDMAVYGGKINMHVLSQSLDMSQMGGLYSVFVPDTLWTHTVDMGETAEQEVVLPDSIFPDDISFQYLVTCDYLSVDNEKRTEHKMLRRKAEDYHIDFSLNKGMLTIKELHKGESQQVSAYLEVSGENGDVLSTDSVMLPHTLAMPWNATDVTIKTKHITDYYFSDKAKGQIGYRFYRANDSIFLVVNNPAKIPFWYTIRKGKKEIAKGYTTNLDYAVKEKSGAGYAMQLSYLFGEEVEYLTEQLPFAEKNMSMEVSTPTTVYPGQKTDVIISVTDRKGKPVNNADITAYSFTSKFKTNNIPNLVVKGKSNYARRFKTTSYESEESEFNQRGKMTWERWSQTMSLDTIAYYKFLYPDPYYKYSEPTADHNTFISPYIVVDGALQGVNMLWIDGRLYYSNLTGHFNNYIFPVEPGRHKLQFRTYDREVTVQNVVVQAGTKNIVSFDVAKPYVLVNDGNKRSTPLIITSEELDKEKVGQLTKGEMRSLSSQLITVDNNFGWMWLPNLSTPIDLPAYIRSGHTIYYLNPLSKSRYDYRLKGYVNQAVLTGPFPSRNYANGVSDMASVYADDKLVTHIGIEGGNKYTLYPGYQKIKSWEGWEINTINKYTPRVDFGQQPMTTDFVRKHFNQRVLNTLSTHTGRAEVKQLSGNFWEQDCRLDIKIGKNKAGNSISPALVFIMPETPEEIGKYQLHYGGTRHFTNLPAGRMRVSLVLNDSVSYSKSICLQPNGGNYLKFDSLFHDDGCEIAQAAFRIFNRNVKKNITQNPYQDIAKDSIVQSVVKRNEAVGDFPGGTITGTVCDSEGMPIIGAFVLLEDTSIGAYTDLDGYFELSATSKAKNLVVSFIGYQSKTIKCSPGNQHNLILKEDSQMLEEVVMVGYGTQKRTDLTGSVSTLNIESQLAGRVPGIRVRGSASQSVSSPLIIINGLPYEGSIDDLDPSQIVSLNVLKDSSSTAIYGSRAANGVVMIVTDPSQVSTKATQGKVVEIPVIESGNSMRRNFHDDAFWQPQLRTDKNGEARFQVTYPDDITSWDAYFVAIGSRKQTDKKRMTIRSFKALTARLSTPRFAIRGDSLNAVGRIANHYGDSISVTRKIEADKPQEDKLKLLTSHVDYIPVQANRGDSVTIAYSLQMENGYFDGEQRSLPILEQGMLQTSGEFKIINDSETHVFTANPELGPATVHMEVSSLDLFLREIEKVDVYPYMCNEQMASKIKALLTKKHIATLIGKKFEEDDKIKKLINRLIKNRNNQGFWGWWNVSNTEAWISRHIVSALLDAEEAGYETKLDAQALSYLLERELQQAMDNLKLAAPGKIPYAKKELLERLINLKRLDASIDYKNIFRSINDQLDNRTLADKLKTMHAMTVVGLKDEINVDSLMHYSGKTLFGSMFWGEKEANSPLYRRFILPHENNVDHTLTAYHILKEIGGHEDELAKIRNYFFECRNNGTWRNIYESSRIMETIIPDMLGKGDTYLQVDAEVNGNKVTKFPYTEKIESSSPIRIKKSGTAPLFATVYQQGWNSNPERESDKGFTVKTAFTENNDTISHLKAGKVAQLNISVFVAADAEYVQIEVPIPAGCSYDSKSHGSYWKEIHREHFKDKVVIFSSKLSTGEHHFTVDLIPRYTGRYSLNPAKAELMYFPTFYGNEEIKKVRIE